MVHPEDRHLIRAATSSALKDHQPISVDYRILRPNGTERVVHQQAQIYIDGSGKPVHVAGVVHDITERIRALEEIRDLQTRTSSILANVADAIITADEVGNIESFNAAAEKIFGYSEEEATGQNVTILMPPSYASEHHDYLRNYVEGSGVRVLGAGVVKLSGKRKDGSTFPVELNVCAMHLNNQRTLIGVVTDISAREQAEERRKSAERELRRAQKMEALGQMAGGMAHEFNNMLVPVIGLTELVVEDLPEDSTERTNLEMALNAANRARGLITQVLAFSRKQKPELEPTLIDGIVRETVKFLQVSLPPKIRIEETYGEAEAVALCDPMEIQQIVMNLGKNAADAMEPDGGEPNIEVSVSGTATNRNPGKTSPSRGQHIVLTVTDTGQGMDEETASQIFNPFFTTKEVGKGTGMGLAVVHGLISDYGGEISVSSEVGKGTRFEIILPLHGGNGSSAQNEKTMENV